MHSRMRPGPLLADHPVFGCSLDALGGIETDAGPFTSGHVAWLHRIVRVPLWALDDDDLALLLVHGRGVPHVVALALHRLREAPWRPIGRSPGFLLLVLCTVPPAWWSAHPEAQAILASCLDAAAATSPDGTRSLDPALAEELAVARDVLVRA
jgi:hypothetical protein